MGNCITGALQARGRSGLPAVEAVEDIGRRDDGGHQLELKPFLNIWPPSKPCPKVVNYGAYIGHPAYACIQVAVPPSSPTRRLETHGRRGGWACVRVESIFDFARPLISRQMVTIASRIGDWREIDYLAGHGGRERGIFQIGPDAPAENLTARSCKNWAVSPSNRSSHDVRHYSTPEEIRCRSCRFHRQYGRAGGRMFGQTTTRSITRCSHSSPGCRLMCRWPGGKCADYRWLNSGASRRPGRARLVADEANSVLATMCSRAAVQTMIRKPTTNLFALNGVVGDPSVAELSEQLGKHPVEVVDLALEAICAAAVPAAAGKREPDHIRSMLEHPRNLATFSDSGAHVCRKWGRRCTPLSWVREKQALLEQAVPLIFDNACLGNAVA